MKCGGEERRGRTIAAGHVFRRFGRCPKDVAGHTRKDGAWNRASHSSNRTTLVSLWMSCEDDRERMAGRAVSKETLAYSRVMIRVVLPRLHKQAKLARPSRATSSNKLSRIAHFFLHSNPLPRFCNNCIVSPPLATIIQSSLPCKLASFAAPRC